MQFQIELEQEEDSRWIAEVLDLPGVLTYGATQEEAVLAAQTLARRVLADRIVSNDPEQSRKAVL